MRLINLIHISPSLSIHKMRPLRAYQSSDDKLIHHDFIWSVHIHTTTQFFPMMMTLSYMHQQSVVIRDKLWVCNKNRLLNDTMLLLLLRCFWLRYLYFFFTLTRGSDNEMRCNQKGAEEIKLFFNFKFMVWGWLGNNYMCASIASFFLLLHAWPKRVKGNFSKNNYSLYAKTTTWRGSNSSSTLLYIQKQIIKEIPSLSNKYVSLFLCVHINFWNELNAT